MGPTLLNEIARLNDGALMVGHSVGGTLFIKRDLGGKLPGGLAIHLYHGLADTTVPPAHAELYARAIPQARLC